MRLMDAAALRKWCLSQPGATEDFPFGPEHSVFKVGGKLFAISALGRTPLDVSVKCEPELAVELRNSYDAIQPGYHLNKRHWNTIALDGSLPDKLVRDLVQDSYDLVVSGSAEARAGGAARPRRPELVPGVEIVKVLPAVGHPAVLELEDDAVDDVQVLAGSVPGAALDADHAVVVIREQQLQFGPEGASVSSASCPK